MIQTVKPNSSVNPVTGDENAKTIPQQAPSEVRSLSRGSLNDRRNGELEAIHAAPCVT
jgi:hypothetical protein